MVNRNPRPTADIITTPAIVAQSSNILRALLHHDDGLTRNELSRVSGVRLQSVCARVGELLDAGLVLRAGHRKCSVSGRVNETIRARPRRKGQSLLEAWT